VVDDDPDQVQTLAWILEQEGYRVEVATDGAESVRRAVASLPDLVLLDGHMPVLDGFAAARLLYADLRTRNIPILFVSGAIDLVSRVRGLGKGDVDFIAKPFSAEALLARIDRLLSQVDAAERLRRSALIDELTGLGNLRALNERLTLEQSRFGRYGTAMAMVVVDVDKLKEFNDRYGHIAGSQALAAVGQALRDTVRGSDLAVRYGGDEFVVLLPQCTAENGFAFAERLLARLHQLMPRERSITASVGVAAMEGRSARLIEELIPQADAAAYRAKRLGGDRACAYDPVADSTEPRIR
jgi:diguanylate cyclase (GGDEF)-like protein